jgi:hypothetical protein
MHSTLDLDPHTELDNLISTELDNPWISTELDSQISTELDNGQIYIELDSAIFRYGLDIYWVRQFILSSPVDIYSHLSK